jgi:UDP-GlcNAc:undecaprenyl-phosphate/decaprenyl-phosphate GlcNAc-1-phosphate transferase
MIDLKRFTYKVKTKSTKIFQELLRGIKNRLVSYSILNLSVVFFQHVYLDLRFPYLNEEIPFWYTNLWGSYQLTSKSNIYLIPLTSLCITLVGVLLLFLLNKFFIRYLHGVVFVISFFCNMFLTFSLLRIVFRASAPFPPLIPSQYMLLLLPFLVAFFFSYFLLPQFLSFARKLKLVTNPSLHAHPAMLLKEPSARGGGVFYALLFLILSLVFVGFRRGYVGFYLAVFMLALLSLVDDFQNTHPDSGFRLIERPFLRLTFMFSVVSLIIFSGITIKYVGTFSSDILPINHIISLGITAVWIVWVMNSMSWSNGIDGQYCGIVGVASLIVSVLALRFDVLSPVHTHVALMAAISAGISFGFAKLTWHPSKIMWGFGATIAGLVISTLSILVNTKVITTVLIMLIPLIDALVIITRRLLQKKNPLKGDKGHLHHILMNRGWSVGAIALFYWLTTAFFGGLSLLVSDKYVLYVLILAGVFVSSFIIILNIRAYKKA